MKIIKIEIKNYRSCTHSSVELNSELSALIGPNGSGKTTILSALRLHSLLCLGGARNSIGELNDSAPVTEIKSWYDVEGKVLVHIAKLNLVTNEKNQDEIIGSQEYWNLYKITGSRKKIDMASWLIADLGMRVARISGDSGPRRIVGLSGYLASRGLEIKDFDILIKVVSEISEVNYYSASQFTNPANLSLIHI